jgi:NAD(P)-dependent dehydrogenase (short-subunit alcohol dehydrogenase family)
VIQISSVGGRTVSAGLGPYQTAKWAVEGFSGVLQREVAPLGIHVTIIEPGGFRTDWAGSSMTMHDVGEEYEDTVGARIRFMAERFTPLGDPKKAAQAILTISEVVDPPLRLLLGTDGYELVRAADRDKMASDERWHELTVSTDHDGAEAQVEELKRMLRVGSSS